MQKMNKHDIKVQEQIKANLEFLKQTASSGVKDDKIRITIDEFTSLQNEFFMKIFQSQNDQ